MFVTIINEKYLAANIVGIHVMRTARLEHSTTSQSNALFVDQHRNVGYGLMLHGRPALSARHAEHA